MAIEKTPKEKILLGFLLFVVVFSYFLIYDHLENGGYCNLGDCDTVRKSAYSEIFGVNLVYIAGISFTLLLIFYHTRPHLFVIGSVIGGLFALYLMTLQFFVIDAICTFCMIIDSSAIIIMILTLSTEKYRKNLKGLIHRKR